MVSGTARSAPFMPVAFLPEGDHLVNITMSNLHSEEEYGHVKYVHNFTKLIKVQNPVLEEFTDENVIEDWQVDTDTDFVMDVDMDLNQPTEPFYNCSWGNGKQSINQLFDLNANRNDDDINYHYHIKHSYTEGGVYEATCTMFNMVSSKTFVKNVSMFSVLFTFLNFC